MTCRIKMLMKPVKTTYPKIMDRKHIVRVLMRGRSRSGFWFAPIRSGVRFLMGTYLAIC